MPAGKGPTVHPITVILQPWESSARRRPRASRACCIELLGGWQGAAPLQVCEQLPGASQHVASLTAAPPRPTVPASPTLYACWTTLHLVCHGDSSLALFTHS